MSYPTCWSLRFVVCDGPDSAPHGLCVVVLEVLINAPPVSKNSGYSVEFCQLQEKV